MTRTSARVTRYETDRQSHVRTNPYKNSWKPKNNWDNYLLVCQNLLIFLSNNLISRSKSGYLIRQNLFFFFFFSEYSSRGPRTITTIHDRLTNTIRGGSLTCHRPGHREDLPCNEWAKERSSLAMDRTPEGVEVDTRWLRYWQEARLAAAGADVKSFPRTRAKMMDHWNIVLPVVWENSTQETQETYGKVWNEIFAATSSGCRDREKKSEIKLKERRKVKSVSREANKILKSILYVHHQRVGKTRLWQWEGLR